jgi:hypothetical protein
MKESNDQVRRKIKNNNNNNIEHIIKKTNKKASVCNTHSLDTKEHQTTIE